MKLKYGIITLALIICVIGGAYATGTGPDDITNTLTGLIGTTTNHDNPTGPTIDPQITPSSNDSVTPTNDNGVSDSTPGTNQDISSKYTSQSSQDPITAPEDTQSTPTPITAQIPDGANQFNNEDSGYTQVVIMTILQDIVISQLHKLNN